MLRRFLIVPMLLVAVPDAAGHEFEGAHGTVTVDWNASNISRVLSSGYGDSFGTEAWARRGFPEVVTVDGRQCIDGTYFLFDVDDDYAFDIDEPVRIGILVDRTSSAGFQISYDQNGVAENIRAVAFPDSGSRWHRHEITLDRARFANRGESGADFTIAAPDGTWFGDPDGDHRIVLCDVVVERSGLTASPLGAGRFRLEVTDGDDPTPARLGLYDESGRMPLPSESALSIRNYEDRTKQVFLRETHSTIAPWPHQNRYFFYADGVYEADVPAGSYTLVVSKGPEFAIETRNIEISEGETTLLEVPLSRWVDMPSQGWYSGDDHVHMARTVADNAEIVTLMRAEDVHVTNLLQMGNPFDTHFSQYAFGVEGRYQAGHHALVSGVEDPRTAVRGHTISLNITEVFRPEDRYLRYDRIFAEYRRQGGMSGYAHVAGRLFNVERGLAIDVPLGAVDFVEVLQDGVLETDLWYEFLNLGFVLVPTAGSDFPYLSAPGGERNYVHVGERFSIDQWYENLRLGHTFVTNGPVLEFAVNGRPMGSTIEVDPGETIRIRAGAALNPDMDRLSRLELVVHGEVVDVVDDVSEGNALVLERDLAIDRGVWLAVRAYGSEQAMAHSAPVYVTTGSGFEKPEAVSELAKRMITRLGEFESVEANPELELEAWSVGENLRRMLAGQRLAILDRADEARAVYARMLDR